jgi:cellulose 1,4-beta-cellobiosidase
VTVGLTTGTTAALTWNPLPGVRSFIVLQATSPTGPWIAANTTQTTPTGAVVIGLNPNSTYYFQLMGIDPLGNQTPVSAIVALTTSTTATTTAGLSVNNLTSSTAVLSWTQVPGAIAYQIVQSTSPNGPWMPAAVVNPTSNGATVTGLLPGVSYYFEVVATDQMGNQIMTSSPAAAVTLSATEPLLTTMLPAPISVTSSGPTGSSVTLTWGASQGATGYTVLQGTSPAGPFAPALVSNMNGTSATITGLNANTTYYFQVIAADPLGHQSAPSNVISAQTTSPVASPR